MFDIDAALSAAAGARPLAQSYGALASRVQQGVLCVCPANDRGLTTALNWAAHAHVRGMRPVIGLDGPLPAATAAAPSSAVAFFRLPTAAEAIDAVANATGMQLPSRSRRLPRADSGYEFWLLRWYTLTRLLEHLPAADILLSDSDVVWHRDPRPWIRAVALRHPSLDAIISSDNSVYAEDWRPDVTYASVEPSRRDLLAEFQRVRVAAGAPSDFDLDPDPSQYGHLGTWNPGLLLVRQKESARALVLAWLVDFASAARAVRPRRLKALSSQTEMNRFITAAAPCCWGSKIDDGAIAPGSHWARFPRLKLPNCKEDPAESCKLREDPSLYRLSLWRAVDSERLTTAAAAFGLPPPQLRRMPCRDDGPWACEGDGCSSATVGCTELIAGGAKPKTCERAFGAVWSGRLPKPILQSTRVSVLCRRTCAMCGTEWRAALGLFPIHQFGSVHAIHVVREADLYGARPYATHATQIKGAGIIFKKNNDNAAGTKGAMGDCTVEALCLGSAIVTQAAVKAYTLRHMGLWRLPEPPSLVDRPLLAYSPRPAAELRAFAFRTQVGTQLERHLALLQVQLQDFQAALALAVALNRSLVLPRVLCSCAFMMWPFFEAANNQNCQPLHLQGLYPRLYECLPSYPFSVPALLRSDLGVRDASALAHPAAADSRLSLLPCVDDGAADGGGGARERGFCSPRGRPILPWRPRASEAAAALGSLRHVRVLHFEGVRDAFGGFDSAADAAAFASRAAPLLGEWCCIVGDGEPRTGAEAKPHWRHPLRFVPPLGARLGGGGGGGRAGAAAAPSSAWAVTRRTNNIFGRAELRANTTCCKYLGGAERDGGGMPSLDACIAAAEARPALRATSVTWHLPAGVEGQQDTAWAGTCYAVVDGTWQPVNNVGGQALSHSAARRVSPFARPPAAANASSRWMRDVAPHVSSV